MAEEVKPLSSCALKTEVPCSPIVVAMANTIFGGALGPSIPGPLTLVASHSVDKNTMKQSWCLSLFKFILVTMNSNEWNKWHMSLTIWW